MINFFFQIFVLCTPIIKNIFLVKRDYKYINLKYLEEMSDDCPEFLTEVIQLFKKQVFEYISALENALSNNNFDEIKRIVHKSKSAMGVVGVSCLNVSLNKYDNKVLSLDDRADLVLFVDEYKKTTFLAVAELDDVLENKK